eukprot:1161418-Pelagomonas_calceolata.AAC.7
MHKVNTRELWATNTSLFATSTHVQDYLNLCMQGCLRQCPACPSQQTKTLRVHVLGKGGARVGGARVVQGWCKGGWCKGGARVVQGWCKGGARVLGKGGARVVQGWCKGGARVVQGWCKGGARVLGKGAGQGCMCWARMDSTRAEEPQRRKFPGRAKLRLSWIGPCLWGGCTCFLQAWCYCEPQQ